MFQDESEFQLQMDEQYRRGYRWVAFVFSAYYLFAGIVWLLGSPPHTLGFRDVYSFLATVLFLCFAFLTRSRLGHVENLGLILSLIALSTSLSSMWYSPKLERTANFMIIVMAMGFGFRGHFRYFLAISAVLVFWVLGLVVLPRPLVLWNWGLSLMAAFTMSVTLHIFLSKLMTYMRQLHRQDRLLMKEKDRILAQLAEAQARVAELLEGPGNMLEDLEGWSNSVAEGLRKTLRAEDIQVIQLEKGGVRSLVSGAHDEFQGPDEWEEALQAPSLPGDRLLLPVKGLSGELRGAILVRGLPIHLQESARQMLLGFASQLGSAMEMIQVRERMSVMELQQGVSLADLHGKGIETLMECPVCGTCYGHGQEQCELDHTPLELPGILPLRFMDRYRLRQRIGVGGMGTVYTAWDERLDRGVAVKIMKPSFFQDTRARLRFERETLSLAKLNHPGIVTILDSGEVGDGTLFLVMELLKGVDLSALLHRDGPGTALQVARLVRQGGEALKAAHTAGILHRDIKPHNLFLLPSPLGFQVKLLDFGLAQSLAGDGRITQTGFLMGTPAYMAPEQLLGEKLDERTDLFAFATVVYEALVGHSPIHHRELGELLRGILNEVPMRVSSQIPGVPTEVDEAFSRALAKDPAQRPSDLLDWALALAEGLEKSTFQRMGWKGYSPMDGEGGESLPSTSMEERTLERALTPPRILEKP